MSNAAKPNTFVTNIDLGLAGKLKGDLQEQDFELTKPPYTLFSAKKKGISCTLYESGKLVVQGKNKDEFIEFYLEPNILQSFTYSYGAIDTEVDTTGRIGIDESGKGDFFGPLCIAGVYASGTEIMRLQELGVRDSKAMTEKTILTLAKKIRAEFSYHVVKINPAKYNELYSNFSNLNKLLAWGHATAIEALVEKTSCDNVIIDQFASEHVVINALKRKNIDINLTQRHRGEEDVVVAAASILAREAFVYGIKSLSEQCGIELAKGASKKTIAAGREYVRTHGREQLPKVAKMHFKTLDAIVT
jgi:ribonuclease HIII